jgi:hypothetical protein
MLARRKIRRGSNPTAAVPSNKGAYSAGPGVVAILKLVLDE